MEQIGSCYLDEASMKIPLFVESAPMVGFEYRFSKLDLSCVPLELVEVIAHLSKEPFDCLVSNKMVEPFKNPQAQYFWIEALSNGEKIFERDKKYPKDFYDGNEELLIVFSGGVIYIFDTMSVESCNLVAVCDLDDKESCKECIEATLNHIEEKHESY